MNMAQLNTQQRSAVETTEGPLLILAGAGSGKTNVITHRIAALINSGVAAYRILAITFTNKAAREMRDRVHALIGEAGDSAWISTFHSMCARMLRKDIHLLGYQRHFSIYDDLDAASVLKQGYKHLDYDEKSLPQKMVRKIISDAKNALITPDEWFAQSDGGFVERRVLELFNFYQQRLRASNALDFDDLLIKTIQLLEEHSGVRDYYRGLFRYIHVDEYQDTNTAQYRLLRLLCNDDNNICVVGDDDQSIYGWRGADIRNILEFENDFSNTTVIKLEQNYRSTTTILDAANSVIQNNYERKDKVLWSELGDGQPIVLHTAEDERGEARYVAQSAQKMIDGGMSGGDIAILYRTNAQSRVVEEALINNGLPYKVYGGLRFYDRKEIKDIVAYLRAVVNPEDEYSIKRIINQPKRSIGDVTISALEKHTLDNNQSFFASILDPPDTLATRAKTAVSGFGELISELIALNETMDKTEFIQAMIDKTQLEVQYQRVNDDESLMRVENIREFVGAAQAFYESNPGSGLGDFLENIALVTSTDETADKNALTLMTMHSAKGLEFRAVFIVGIEEGIFPGSRADSEPGRMEEERRLFYVGITRAKQRLFLLNAQSRFLYNSTSLNPPSRFLSEIPERLTLREEPEPRFARYAEENVQKPYAPRRDMRTVGINASGGGLGIPGVQKGFGGVITAASSAHNIKNAGVTYKPGDMVLHKMFGRGEVLSVDYESPSGRIKIAFENAGEKEFILDKTPIVKIGV